MNDDIVADEDEDRLSYAAIIRDILFARTVVIPFFNGFTARRCKQLPIEPYHLPYLGVYFVRETRRPDGDPNHGTVDFIHHITCGFSIQMQDNDMVRLENKLHRAWRLLDETLWANQYIIRALDTYDPSTGTRNPENLSFEGVASTNCLVNWGSIGKNETPFAELQFEPTVILRSIWPPVIEDDLLEMGVEAVPMVGPRGNRHPPPRDEVKRIIMQYEFQP